MSLLTVIITDRKTTPVFMEHRNLFSPFFMERGGSIRHCTWDGDGRSIEKAVPDLYKTIKGYPEWRAIILVHPEQKEELQFTPDNPFDFVCNQGNELEIRENPAPLVRLTHMLGGYPSLGVKEYKSGCVYYDAQSGSFLECRRDDGSFVTQEDFEGYNKTRRKQFYKKFSDNVKFRLYEVPYSKEERCRHNDLTKGYSIKENRPAEILILSTRELLMPDDREATREAVRYAWQFHDEADSSGFWRVYPNKCRFLCYNLVNPEHTLYRRELWRFFLLALTIAVNKIPAQALQAYFLYKTDIHIDNEDLKRSYDEYLENLMSVRDVIQERLHLVPELTLVKNKELVPKKHISVNFDHVNEGDVLADSSKFGLSSDCPKPEAKEWRGHILGTRQTIDNILYTPQEVVAARAFDTRSTINSFMGNEQVLDRFQLDRIRKRMDELEPHVINTSVYGMLNSEALKAEVAEEGNKVQKSMGLRLTKRNVFLISLCSLLLYLCGYVPYLINSAKINMSIFGASFVFALVTLIPLAAGGLFILWLLRRRLIKKINTYNKAIKDIFDRVSKSARIFSEYFSNMCTYMYAHSLLSGVTLKKDNVHSESKILNAHLVTIEKEVEAAGELCKLYGVQLNSSSERNTLPSKEEDYLVEMPCQSWLYEFPKNNEKDKLKFITPPKLQQLQSLVSYNAKELKQYLDQHDTYLRLDAPYTFIAGMSLVREEIYDKREDKGKKNAEEKKISEVKTRKKESDGEKSAN